MARTDRYTAKRGWTAVQNNAGEIENGVFSVVNLDKNPIELIQATTLPSASEPGHVVINQDDEGAKFELFQSDRLFIKSPRGNIDVSVVTS